MRHLTATSVTTSAPLGWDRGRITTAMTEGANNRWVAVQGAVPVYVLYTTVAVKDGRIFFFDDIYGYDAVLANALDNRYAHRTASGGARTDDTAGGGDGDTRVSRSILGPRTIAPPHRPRPPIVSPGDSAPPVGPLGRPRVRAEGL